MSNNNPVTLYGGKVCIPFYKFINNTKKFCIVNYQRQYVWRVEKVKELWASILKKCKNNKSLWLGVILGSKRDGESFEIIDGQQRILTFLLMYFSLCPDEPFWEELYFTHEHLTNKSDDVLKSIFTVEIIDYLVKKKEPNSYLLKKIIECLKDSVSKSKEDPKNHEVLLNFIKKQLLITVLYTTIDGYPFFERINSGVPLSLYERCYSFIAYNDWSLIKGKNKSNFQELENSSNAKKNKFIKFFIKIFSFQQNIEVFEQFKKIYKGDDRKDFFFSYLKEYIEPRRDITGFYKYYAHVIAWDNYWPIIVLLYVKKYDKKFIQEKFFETLWNWDLHLHLNEAKHTQASSTISCAKNIYNSGNILAEGKILDFLNQFWSGRILSLVSSVEELRLNEQKLMQVSFNKNYKKQLKILLCVLQNSRIKDSEGLKKWMEGIGFRKWEKKEIEHLVPQSWDKKGDIQKDINKIFNLVLVHKDINIKLSDSCIFCKIKILCSESILTHDNCVCYKKESKALRCYCLDICKEWHDKNIIIPFDQEATIKNIWDINKKKYLKAYEKITLPSLTIVKPTSRKNIYQQKLANSNFKIRGCYQNECNNNCWKNNDNNECRWPLILLNKFPRLKLQFHLEKKPSIKILKGSRVYTKTHISDKTPERIKKRLIAIDKTLPKKGIICISYKNNKKEYSFLKEHTFQSLNEFGEFISRGACNAWTFFTCEDDNWPSSQHPLANSN